MSAIELKLLISRDLEHLPASALLELQAIFQKYLPKKTPAPQKPRQFGCMKGLVKYMAPDFNAPLDEFKEYMP